MVRISAPVNEFGAGNCVTIGLRLKEERERLGMTQTALGEVAAAAKRTVIDWEKGVSSPNGFQLEALAQHGLDVQYVLTGTPAKEALSVDELELLGRYRSASLQVKAAALGALMAGAAPLSTSGQVFHAEVGQAVKVEGDLDQRGISFVVGGKDKKRK